MDKAVQNEMFTELLSQIDASSTTETKVLKTRNRFLRQIGRYAAVACIILAVGSGAYYAGVKRPADDANTEVTMSVSNGQKADIILADGTKVYINSDSRIVYDNTYNKKTRMVSLEGEAYFEVAKDKEKPFIVKANGINVQALGTSFNIRAHKDDKSVAVILISGKVKVDDGRHEAYMKPNERLVCNLTNGQFEKASFILMQATYCGEATNWHSMVNPLKKFVPCLLECIIANLYSKTRKPNNILIMASLKTAV